MFDLLIVGASARAAAMSAKRAGFSPWSADIFADADLRAIVPATIRCPIDRYPSAFLELMKSAPDAPWIYTGGLENDPQLIDELADIRPLWGNGPESLAVARSPFAIERCLRDAGLPALEVRSASDDLPVHCQWVRKPFAGSAGRGIEKGDAARFRAEKRTASPFYYQRFAEGTPMSAVFVRIDGRVVLLGITEQLIGVSWLNAPPFRYAGNIGPIVLPAAVAATVAAIGNVIGETCDLHGLFGVDFVLAGDTPWLVEANPRYPASVEILEAATEFAALAFHAQAFDRSRPSARLPRSSKMIHGKAILYAAERCQFPIYTAEDQFGREARNTDDRCRQFADIPAPGETIEGGWPILTVFAEGSTRLDCYASLRRRTLEVVTTINSLE